METDVRGAHYLSDYTGEDTYDIWKAHLKKRRFDIDDEKWQSTKTSQPTSACSVLEFV